ncbi:helix-hairpin-helix domain-containing protein [Fictibacillus nanhaiensis]|uniref:Helix-hairpin-helix domain-containing protein n=1 Tax=Fictibacillus nanhaiensis TaxID=742169 RepID=A0ABS2ZN97_9BACL|nr:helix-hairpin-helix domain-containing protein [Fictibacillus nanhaiensis]
MASVTDRGKFWEMKNSIWMLWVFLTFGFFNYISFFYVSYKVKQRKWFVAGILYSIPFILMMITADTVLSDTWLNDVGTMSYIIGYIVSILHVIKIRPEYLLRLDAKLSSGYKEKEIDYLKKTIAREYGAASVIEKQPVLPSKTVDEQIKFKEEKEMRVEQVMINETTEEELAKVPGIGGLFAKKIISTRSQENGFQSFNHFVEVLSVKPHLAEKIRPYLLFPEKEPVVVSAKKTEGRVIDF